MNIELLCLVVAFVVVAASAAPSAEPEVWILESQMSQKEQQEAVAAIKEVWPKSGSAKRCDQLSFTFKESHWPTDWPCYKYPASAEEGAYSIGPKAKKHHIRCLVIDAVTKQAEHVVLFGVKQYL